MKKERNMSLDLLRIICMLMVVWIHSFSHGGLFKALIPGSANWYGANVLNAFGIVAVNCFVLRRVAAGVFRPVQSGVCIGFCVYSWRKRRAVVLHTLHGGGLYPAVCTCQTQAPQSVLGLCRLCGGGCRRAARCVSCDNVAAGLLRRRKPVLCL